MSLQLLADHIAKHGRGEDSVLMHVTPGEAAGLQVLAMRHGGSLTRNPHTGLLEAGFLSSILPTIVGIGAGAFLGPMGGALAAGLTSAATGGGLSGALMSGIGAYGMGNIGDALGGMGQDAAQAAQATQAGTSAAAPMMSVPDQTGSDWATAGGNSTVPESYTSMDGANGYNPDTTNVGQYSQNAPVDVNAGNAYADAAASHKFVPLSKLEAMKQGITSPGAMSKLMKNNKTDMMMAGAGLLPIMGGLGSLGQKGTPGYPYSTSSYRPVTQTSRALNPNARYNAPGSAEQDYFLNNSRGIAAAAGGGAVGDMLDFQAGGELQPGPIDSTQRPMTIQGNPMGFASGGSPMLVDPSVTASLDQSSHYTPPAPYTADNSGFYQQTPQVQRNYTPFSLYGGAQGTGSGGGNSTPAPAVATPTLTPPVSTPAAGADAHAGMYYTIPGQGFYDPQGNPIDAQTWSSLTDSQRWTAPAGYTPAGTAPAYDTGGGAGVAKGGLMHKGLGALGGSTYAAGGQLLDGPGDGVSDDIPAVIEGGQRAALADGEYVVPARTVSELGNGSTKAGARKLEDMVKRVEKARKKVGRGMDSGAYKHLPA